MNSNEHDVNELINVMFQDELQFFKATFDTIKNEVIPSITLAIESLNRAEQEYKNGQQIRLSRIDTIYQNADEITSMYFTPRCIVLQDRISKFQQFADDEFQQLQNSLNLANANARNLITFQTLWQDYEMQLQECISKPTNNKQEGGLQNP